MLSRAKNQICQVQKHYEHCLCVLKSVNVLSVLRVLVGVNASLLYSYDVVEACRLFYTFNMEKSDRIFKNLSVVLICLQNVSFHVF